MRVLFSGAGTAGHVMPAVAIAEALLKLDAKTEVKFIGREGGRECDCVIKRKYPIDFIKVHGLQRSLGIKNAKVLTEAVNGVREAKKIIEICGK